MVGDCQAHRDRAARAVYDSEVAASPLGAIARLLARRAASTALAEASPVDLENGASERET